MKTRHLPILALLLFCGTLPIFSQNDGSKYLTGRVAAMRDGQPAGVADVKVEIRDFHYDITDTGGYFKLALPPEQDFVSIELANTAFRMISPYSGIVNLPPDEKFQILVCNGQNQQLLKKVADLDGQIKKLEAGKKLSRLQISAMQKTLVDTLFYFEKLTGGLEAEIEVLKKEKAENNQRIAELESKIAALESSNRELSAALFQALQKKFLRQKGIVDTVSAGLLEYADRLKDLRDQCRPSRLPMSFRSEAAMDDLAKKIGAYNEQRELILKNYRGEELAVREFWENPTAAESLRETHAFLFKTVHDAQVIPLDQQVFEQLRAVLSKQTGRVKGQKTATAAAENIVPGLDQSIFELETRIAATLKILETNL